MHQRLKDFLQISTDLQVSVSNLNYTNLNYVSAHCHNIQKVRHKVQISIILNLREKCIKVFEQ